ncbi:peroxide stress protein YaaA [Seminibacterium arietis]|uniref:UPF0246 protein ACFQ02_06540 n=1 Tax=Seminibacterium arietis TaxID=1173502 RepID=A0ABW3I9N4_9PAST
MLVIISPAKTLNCNTALPKDLADKLAYSQPSLTNYSEQLIRICRQFSPNELASLMSISDKLAGLNVARFAEWQKEHDEQNSRAAIYAFNGDVYTGLSAETLNIDEIGFAQQNLRILSGLYGLLRPLDLIQPYRLEMGTKLANAKGNDLYAFWGDKIAQLIQKTLDNQNERTLINLASDEYYKAVQGDKLRVNVIKPIFLDFRNGKYKIISFYAKKARGLMCRYIIQNRLMEAEQLKEFDLGGYWFDTESSTANEFVFKRDLSE